MQPVKGSGYAACCSCICGCRGCVLPQAVEQSLQLGLRAAAAAQLRLQISNLLLRRQQSPEWAGCGWSGWSLLDRRSGLTCIAQMCVFVGRPCGVLAACLTDTCKLFNRVCMRPHPCPCSHAPPAAALRPVAVRPSAAGWPAPASGCGSLGSGYGR
jgi:hypothetical protein